MMDLCAEVEMVCRLVDEGIKEKKPFWGLEPTSIAKKVSEYPQEIVSAVLGDIGTSLTNYSKLYDINHPYSAKLLSCLEHSKVFKELCDALQIAKFAIDNNMVNILDILLNHFNNINVLKVIAKSLNNPPIRALKGRGNRDNARGNDKVDILFNEVKISSQDWLSQPDTFKSFVRLHSGLEEEIKNLKKVQKKLETMGIIEQARVCNNQINAFVSKASTQYCGFWNISLQHAGCILGKIHNYEHQQRPYAKIGLPVNDPKVLALLSFMVPNRILWRLVDECLMGDRNNYDRFDTFVEGIKKNKANPSVVVYDLLTQYQVGFFSYNPRLYPLCAFNLFVSERTKNLVDCLETFEDNGGFPLFDKYLILVPGIKFDQENKFQQETTKTYRFKFNDKSVELDSKDEVYFLIDGYLAKNKLVSPILLGQKDDEYYFLDYWCCAGGEQPQP